MNQPSSSSPMAASDLEQAIQQYATTLDRLVPSVNPPTHIPPPAAATPPVPAEANAVPVPANNQATLAQILEVLTARDRVQAALDAVTTSTDSTPPSGESLEKLSHLDQTLREQVATIAPFTESADWRASFNPNQNAWWWFLETPKNSWSDRYDWFWSAASVTFLTICLGLLGDIAPRFLTGGPDSFGAFAVSAQSVLTLLAAGGALTTAGQEAFKRFLKAFNCPEKYWHELGAIGTLLLMLGFFSLRQSLPQIATAFYTNPGIKNYNDGDWSTAEEQFQRAIQLNADDAQAHFQLGKLYEDLQMPDQARPQYRLAVQGGIPAATNNLARLNILKKEYTPAVSLLLKLLDMERKQPLDPKTKHAVLKNLGWARLKQKNYPDAEARLLEAIDLESQVKFERDEIADSHCLLAQVMEAQGDEKGALAEWKICNENANITIPEQDEWAALAQKQLAQQEKSR